MKRARTSRWWLTFVLFFSLTVSSLGNLFAPQTVAAAPTPLHATYTIIVKATFTGGATAPTQDGITFNGQSFNGNRTSTNGNTTTYRATGASVSWVSDVPPPSNLQACSIVLNKCTGNFTATPGNHTITITGSTSSPGNGSGDSGNQSNSPECTDSNDPLSWIICPIFQAAADSSEWILNTIVTPFLLTQPIDTSANNPLYQVWSNFRLYGDIFLVIALLVLVFGQSIGGGLVDAYTVKKALPRVLVAAILVNLSIYIVAFMIDITNIIGKSIGDILTAPFKAADSWHFTPNAAQGIGVLSIGILGYFLARGGILQTFENLFSGSKNAKVFEKLAGHDSFPRVALEAGLLIAVPMILAILAVFVTLLIRKGLILFLVLISPVAFALYALPNTEQYFRKWWNLLLEALMVFPIIIIIFAMADILSLTILQANNVNSSAFGSGVVQGTASFLAILVALVLQFLPLFIVPFAFRMAGGILGRLHEYVANTHGKVGNFAGYKHAREHAQQRLSDRYAQAGNELKKRYLAESEQYAPNSWKGKRMRRKAGWAAGRDIEYRIAEINKRNNERKAINVGNGPDDYVRASTANRDMLHAAEHGGLEELRDHSEWKEGTHYRAILDANGNETGGVELASLGGKWYNTATVAQAYKLYGGDEGALQTNLSYEMSKSTETKQKKHIIDNYGAWATSQGWSNATRMERWIGPAFENQQIDKNYKHYAIGDDGNLKPVNALGQIVEMNRTEGSWQAGSHSAIVYDDLSQNISHAMDVIQGVRPSAGMFVDQKDGTTARALAEQYVQEAGAHVAYLESPATMGRDPETGQPIPAGAGMRVLSTGSVETSAAAQRFVNMFHHRVGHVDEPALNEVAKPGQAPAAGQLSHGAYRVRTKTTEEGVAGTHSTSSPPGIPTAAQVQRSHVATDTPRQQQANAPAGGTPRTAQPADLYVNPPPVRPGHPEDVESGAGGNASWTRLATDQGRGGIIGEPQTGLRVAPPPRQTGAAGQQQAPPQTGVQGREGPPRPPAAPQQQPPADIAA